MLELDIILYASQVVVAPSSYSPNPWFGGGIQVDSREWDRESRQQQVELLWFRLLGVIANKTICPLIDMWKLEELPKKEDGTTGRR